MIKETTSY